MTSWSLKRRVTYISIVLGFLGIIAGWFLFVGLYQPSTCFDGKQNGLEAGPDCGGECEFLCPFQVAEPVVLFSRAFQVADGVYNAVAYVENPNFNIGNVSVPYTFKFYDKNNTLVDEETGRTFISAGQISPIFIGPLSSDHTISRTVFELNDNGRWKYVKSVTESPFVVRNKKLSNADTLPKVEAAVENTTVNEYKDVEVVTVVYNALENAIATSRTFIDTLPRKGSVPVTFTWPTPFAKELEACTVPVDAALLIDVSGSMNNDNDDPPQPLTDAKNAASDFVGRLSPNDRAGLITFATHSTLLQGFSNGHDETRAKIDAIGILPEEEEGSTNMGDAIHDASRILEADSAPRPNAKKVIVLLTDGIANEPEDPGGEPYALQFAGEAKSKGYTIYTIGIGEGVNAPFLREVATKEESIDDQYFFKAATSKDLADIYANISDAICERGPAIIDIIPRLPVDPL